MEVPSRDARRDADESAARPPRLLVAVLGDIAHSAQLVEWLARIPADIAEQAAEIAVLLHVEREDSELPANLVDLVARRANVHVHPDVRRYGHGGRRKVAFEYALHNDFDHVVVVEPDDRFPPAALSRMWSAAAQSGAELVILARNARSGLERAWSGAVNALLALEVADFSSPCRLIRRSVLQRVPFHLNGDGRSFDTELLIQARALGVDAHEVVADAAADATFSYVECLRIAIGYRCHQLHLTRRGQYLVDHDIHYTLKHHPASSHMQVLAAVPSGSLVLDLGCSQGLLAGPLARKGVRVVGVDVRKAADVSRELAQYYQRDLEQPLEIPEGRVFDYVVCSDVIEHVIHRPELLRSVRRYLKPEGRLLISTPNIAIWFYRLSLLVGRFEYGPRGVLDETHVHLFTRATFRREIENAAFRIVRERVTALPFEVAFESTGRSALIQSLTSFYHALARLWPEVFAYQFLLEAEVRTLMDRGANAPQVQAPE